MSRSKFTKSSTARRPLTWWRRAIAAADVAIRHRLALADAVMYALALEHKATFWTQDVDYQGLPGVNFFPKP